MCPCWYLLLATAPTVEVSPQAATLSREVMRRIEVLAQYSETPEGLTRTFLSPAMKDVHHEVQGWMEAAGMSVRTDAVGNIIGRFAAAEATNKTLLIGSHLDTVRNAGKYDGMLGVLLGIALVESLPAARAFNIDVIGFSDEEGVRFGATYFGSQGITGTFASEQLELRDQYGISLREAIERYGLSPDEIAEAAYKSEDVLAFLEVHIEQGPLLEHLGQPLGVVDAIVGQSRLELRFVGQAGHAGTTPMDLRRDALVAAAAFILAVTTYAGAQAGLVATVGRVEVQPNATNVIPAEVLLSLDVRHKDDALRLQAVTELLAEAEKLAAQHSVTVYTRELFSEPTTWLHPGLSESLWRHSQGVRMVSGAGHDCAIMSRFAASALLFVRCAAGLSHHPDEAVAEADVACALQALQAFVEGYDA